MDVGRSTLNSLPPQPQSLTTADLDDDDDDLPAPGKVWEGPQESLTALMAKHTAATAVAAPEPSNIEPVRSANLGEKWKAMLALLTEQAPALSGLLQEGEFVGIEDGRAVIRYAPERENHVKMLERNGKKDLVRDAISKVMEQSVGVRFEVAEQSPAANPALSPVSKPATAAPRSPEPPRPGTRIAPPPPSPVEPTNTIRLTDEIRDSLYKNDALIRAVVDTLGGSIIRLEEPE